MTENEAIEELKEYADNSWGNLNEAFKMAIQALEKQSMLNELLHEFKELETEIQQYRAIGTVEELKSLKESNLTALEMDNLWCVLEDLKRYSAIGTIEELHGLKETTVTQNDINAFKAYIDDCMDEVAFGNTDWNRSLALALKCMELHKLDWQ